MASMAVGWVLIPRADPLDDGPDHMVIAAFTNRFVAKFEFLSTYYGNEFGREHYLCKGQSIRTDVPQLFMTSCGPSTTQLEAAEHQARWLLSCSEAGDAGEEAEVDDPIIDRGAYSMPLRAPVALPVRLVQGL